MAKTDVKQTTQFTATHIVFQTPKSFDDVAKALESQVGRFDAEVTKSIATGDHLEAAEHKIATMAGPSGFMLFSTADHGSLLRMVGQKRKAIQYVVGNPLIALQMTRHDVRAGLYAPLRVLLYERQDGKTCLEYDLPSALFGQFDNAAVTAVAQSLDRKLEALAAMATQ